MFSLFKRPPISRREVVKALLPTIGEERARVYFAGLKRGYTARVPLIYDDFGIRPHDWIYGAGIDAGTSMREHPASIDEIFESSFHYIRSRSAHELGASKEQARSLLNPEPDPDVS